MAILIVSSISLFLWMAILFIENDKLHTVVGILTVPAFITIFVISLLLVSACGDNYAPIIPDATPISSFGESCISDETCDSELCAEKYLDVVLPDGMCTNSCVWGSGCEEGYCVFYNNNDGYCFPSCEQGDNPCREGWECVFIIGVRLCVPDELGPA